MIKIKQYLPYILIAFAFIAGQLLSSNPDKELKKNWEAERKFLLKDINTLQKKIDGLQKAGNVLAKKMADDSVKSVIVLKNKDVQISKLRNKINEIDFKNATASDLDSIRSKLYGTR